MEPAALASHLSRERVVRRAGPASRVRQTKVRAPKRSVKAPGYGCVTARTRSWISFAGRRPVDLAVLGLPPPKWLAFDSSWGADVAVPDLELLEAPFEDRGRRHGHPLRDARAPCRRGRSAPRSWSTIVARRRPARSSRGASRRSRVSPFRTAQLTGARPRNFGSREPCMLSAPSAATRENLARAGCSGSRTRRGGPAPRSARACSSAGSSGLSMTRRLDAVGPRELRDARKPPRLLAGASGCVATRTGRRSRWSSSHLEAGVADRPSTRRRDARAPSCSRPRAFRRRGARKPRPAAHLLVDPADVLADDPDPRHERCRGRRRASAKSVKTPSTSAPTTSRRTRRKTPKAMPPTATVTNPIRPNTCSGTTREAGHEVEVQADEPVERVLRLAGRRARRARPRSRSGGARSCWPSAGMNVEASSRAGMISTTSSVE